MNTLDGRVALVTGAGQGIGRGVAYALAADGAAVAAVGRTESKLRETCKEIERRGGHAIPLVCDVTERGQVDETVGRVVAELGTVDALVNCAQDFVFGPLLDLDPDAFATAWSSGALGSLHLMKACHPHLRDGGAIVNVGSGAAASPGPGVAGYAAVKAAVTSLSRSAAVEFAGDGIRVNTIIPFALTPPVQAVFDAHPEYAAQAVDPVPLGRIGDPEADIGRAVAFLCGPDAAYVTGTTLTVDGGETYLR